MEGPKVSTGVHIEYLGHGDFAATVDGKEYTVYCPITVKGDHGDDSEWAGKMQIKDDAGGMVNFRDEAYEKIDKEMDKFDPIDLAQHDMMD